MPNARANAHKLRLLVAIASYGSSHLDYLNHIIKTYRSMDLDVDVVVLSEAPKNLGDQAEVIVGLPSRNPWTLPFAHKPVFAERVDQYDLFIYSEDDIGVNEAHIQAFLKATDHLESDEIAGFVRCENAACGTWFVDEPWGHYHWKPESVRRRGPYIIAEFSNEHTGFYILTQNQLQRAIASGGFLRGPCRGRYGWPETAATDPYTNCGFRKVICISALESFLVHHMSNRYVHLLDVSVGAFKEQVQTLLDIADGRHPASTLCAVESNLWPSSWAKCYYEKPGAELLNLVPRDAREILSIGCGWGAVEAALKERGAEVAALPLDSVIGAVAQRRGIAVLYGTWDECLKRLTGRQFDCVIMTNLLHLQPSPNETIAQIARLVRKGGALILGGPNFDRVPWLIKRFVDIDGFGRLRSYNRSGFSTCGPSLLAGGIESAGLHIDVVRWFDHTIGQGWLRGRQLPLGRLTARDWILRARR